MFFCLLKKVQNGHVGAIVKAILAHVISKHLKRKKKLGEVKTNKHIYSRQLCHIALFMFYFMVNAIPWKKKRKLPEATSLFNTSNWDNRRQFILKEVTKQKLRLPDT